MKINIAIFATLSFLTVISCNNDKKQDAIHSDSSHKIEQKDDSLKDIPSTISAPPADPRTALILRAYQNYLEKPGNFASQKQFFDVFPKSFDELDSLYGYAKEPGPLYYEHVDHILNGFYNLDQIADTLMYTRLINLGIGGHWDADAVNWIQDFIQKKILANPNLTFTVLHSKTLPEIQSFFYFFNNGIHPIYRELPTELEGVREIDEDMYLAMKTGFDEGLSDSSHD